MPLSLQWSLIVFSSILAPGFAVGIRTMVVVTVQGAPASINCIVATIKRSQSPLPSAATFNAAIRLSSSANLERIYGIPIPKREKGQVGAFGLLGLLLEFDLEKVSSPRDHAIMHCTVLVSVLF